MRELLLAFVLLLPASAAADTWTERKPGPGNVSSIHPTSYAATQTIDLRECSGGSRLDTDSASVVYAPQRCFAKASKSAAGDCEALFDTNLDAAVTDGITLSSAEAGFHFRINVVSGGTQPTDKFYITCT